MSAVLDIAAASLVAGLVLQPILIPWLRRRGVMDVPNHRSSHTVATPRGGGIAVIAALGVGLLVGQVDSEAWLVYLGALALSLVGLSDDFGGVDPRLRLGALLLVGGTTGAVLGSSAPLLVAVTLMALWSAAYVNAFNFMDGINGISALNAMVAGATYVALGLTYSSPALPAIGAALFGSSLSFLPFNFPRARVFLGDVGSYGIGFAIASSAWLAWGTGVPLLLALSPTLVYLTDTGFTLLRRARAGAPLMEAHRTHMYQRLVDAGRSPIAVALGYSGVSALVVCTLGRWGTTGLAAAAAAAAAAYGLALITRKRLGWTRGKVPGSVESGERRSE